MPTFMFRSTQTGVVRHATSRSLNNARDVLAIASPEKHFHDGSLWQPWECWEGGKCLWHYTEAGECVDGPRSKP